METTTTPAADDLTAPSWNHDRTADVELTIAGQGGTLTLQLSLKRTSEDDLDGRLAQLVQAARGLTARLLP